MNIDYSDEINALFASPMHVYSNEDTNLIGYAGDVKIGEYVHLYFQVQKESNYADSKILQARFSAIGSVMLIAAAEKFCSLIEGLSFQESIKYCGVENGLLQILSAPAEKYHSIHFVEQAFYNALETLATS